MATIYDIARRCGLSAATVSYVLSGQAEARKIPPATQERVRQAASELHYQPNLSARRLRNAPAGYTVAVYWPSDHFELALMSVMEGIQQALASSSAPMDVIVRPYARDQLSQDKALFSPNTYHAAVLVSLGRRDAEFLREHRPLIPTVLLNREIEGYHQVLIDNQEAGTLAANLALAKGGSIDVLLSSASLPALDVRCDAFLSACRHAGAHIQDLLHAEDSGIDGGYRLGLRLTKQGGLPSVLFCASDAIALGLLSAFHSAGVAVGKDVQVITLSNTLPMLTAHTAPALTVVDLRLKETTCQALLLVQELLTRQVSGPQYRLIHPVLIPRASCPAE